MNPIAYTYDWGLTTAVARKNQALLTGALGIEHILRSPDLPEKREDKYNLGSSASKKKKQKFYKKRKEKSKKKKNISDYDKYYGIY